MSAYFISLVMGKQTASIGGVFAENDERAMGKFNLPTEIYLMSINVNLIVTLEWSEADTTARAPILFAAIL